MKAFLSTCVLLALFLPEVANLICRDNEINDDFDACEIDEGICFKHFFVSNLNGSEVDNNVKMGCAKKCPSTNYTFSILDGYLENVIYCCQDFLCNDKIIHNSFHYNNGRRCPFYDASDPNDCPKLRNFKCSGDETRCIEFVLVHNNRSIPKKVYNGCATPSFCMLAKTKPYNGHLSGTITEARCGETLPV